MPEPTDIPAVSNNTPPSPRRGEGWGEGERALARVGAGLGHIAGVGHPHPTLSLKGEGFRIRLAVSRDQQRLPDFLQHPFGVRQHIVVPEADNRVAMRFDQRCPRRVRQAFGVLATVELDHQPCLAASEVGHMRANRELRDKLRPLDLTVADARPQSAFGVGHRSAQSARGGRQSLRNHRRITLTQPSPSRERAIMAA